MYQISHSGDRVPIHGSFFGQSSFSRLTICHPISVIPIPEKYNSIPMELLASFGCGYSTGAGAILNVLNPAVARPRTLAVFGVGAVGFAALFAAKATCPPKTQIIAVDITPSRLDLASQLGAKILNSREIDLSRPGPLKEAIQKLTGEVGLDAAVDTTGNSKLVAQILHSLAPLGKLVTLANSGWEATVEIKLADLMIYAKQWVGCIMGNGLPVDVTPLR
jgi:aryl-alcohol dehydrogenase